MSPRENILTMARERGIKSTSLSKAMKYAHVNSLYRALSDPSQISYGRIKKLAKVLGVDVCQLIAILK